MEKGFKHRLSELVMLIGTLSVFSGFIGVAFLSLKTEYVIALGVGGFIIFLLGVELYLKTRETFNESNVSNTGSRS